MSGVFSGDARGYAQFAVIVSLFLLVGALGGFYAGGGGRPPARAAATSTEVRQVTLTATSFVAATTETVSVNGTATVTSTTLTTQTQQFVQVLNSTEVFTSTETLAAGGSPWFQEVESGSGPGPGCRLSAPAGAVLLAVGQFGDNASTVPRQVSASDSLANDWRAFSIPDQGIWAFWAQAARAGNDSVVMAASNSAEANWWCAVVGGASDIAGPGFQGSVGAGASASAPGGAFCRNPCAALALVHSWTKAPTPQPGPSFALVAPGLRSDYGGTNYDWAEYATGLGAGSSCPAGVSPPSGWAEACLLLQQ